MTGLGPGVNEASPLARILRVTALMTTVVLVAACGSRQASGSPTLARSPDSSASSAPVSTSAPPAPPSAPPTAAPSPIAAHWESAGTMAATLRVTHAVVLGDGRVLVIGSDSESGAARSVVWDSSTGGWHTTEALNKPRSEFVAVALADGRVLVTGGLNDTEQSYSSTYIYDPAPDHESWSKSGLLGTARTAPSAAVLPDGRVLVVGGYFHVKPSYASYPDPGIVLAGYRGDSIPETKSIGHRLADIDPPNVGAALATAELFDPATGTWSDTGPLKYARFGANAVTLSDGRVLVVGSRSDSGAVTVDGHAFATAEIYDPATGRFGLAGTLPDIDRAALERQGAAHANPVPEYDPQPADGGTLVALEDGGAVLIGQTGWWKHAGDITRSFRFDPKTNRWSEIGETWIVVGEPTAVILETPGVHNLSGAMVARLRDGSILVAGGSGETPNGSSMGSTAGTGASAELYDPVSDTWTDAPPMAEVRSNAAVAVLKDGSVLLVGGFNYPKGSVMLSSAIRFVPAH